MINIILLLLTTFIAGFLLGMIARTITARREKDIKIKETQEHVNEIGIGELTSKVVPLMSIIPLKTKSQKQREKYLKNRPDESWVNKIK